MGKRNANRKDGSVIGEWDVAGFFIFPFHWLPSELWPWYFYNKSHASINNEKPVYLSAPEGPINDDGMTQEEMRQASGEPGEVIRECQVHF